jgi:hypothetical protein
MTPQVLVTRARWSSRVAQHDERAVGSEGRRLRRVRGVDRPSRRLPFALFGCWRRSAVGAVRLFAPFGCSRRSPVRAVRLFAPFGCSRRSAVRAVRLFAPFGCSRRSAVRAVRPAKIRPSRLSACLAMGAARRLPRARKSLGCPARMGCSRHRAARRRDRRRARHGRRQDARSRTPMRPRR